MACASTSYPCPTISYVQQRRAMRGHLTVVVPRARCSLNALHASKVATSSAFPHKTDFSYSYSQQGTHSFARRTRRQGVRTWLAASNDTSDSPSAPCSAERREFYDSKDMPPLPLTVSRIIVPALGHVVVDKSCELNRMASLAIFYDISQDDQYRSSLNRRSAITALCMYDRDDVEAADRQKGLFPNIDLLQRVYAEGLELPFVVEEF